VDPDHGNPAFQIDVDSDKNTASALLIDRDDPGNSPKYECNIQPSLSNIVVSMTALICMGPQLAPNVGLVVTTFALDLVNKTASAQNTLVQPTGLKTLSSFPATQCN